MPKVYSKQPLEKSYTSIFFDGDIDDSQQVSDWTDFGVSFALSQKWVSKNGFILELSIGGGRYFGGKQNSPEGFFRGGVLVGYRF